VFPKRTLSAPLVNLLLNIDETQLVAGLHEDTKVHVLSGQVVS
jgi:hypothetical protein